jgi:hypothetical protein
MMSFGDGIASLKYNVTAKGTAIPDISLREGHCADERIGPREGKRPPARVAKGPTLTDRNPHTFQRLMSTRIPAANHCSIRRVFCQTAFMAAVY